MNGVSPVTGEELRRAGELGDLTTSTRGTKGVAEQVDVMPMSA